MLKLITNSKIPSIFQKFSSRMFSHIDYKYPKKDFLSRIDDYEKKVDDHPTNNFNITDEIIEGAATESKTLLYSESKKEEVIKQHFRKCYYNNWTVSSIGIGTYIGNPDDLTDFSMYNAIKECVLSGGVNMIDTAINYRYMKSERTVGKAVNALVNKFDISRDQLIVASKIGYVPEDADNGVRCHHFVKELVESNKITIDDIIYDEMNRPIHCIHPEFLEQQLSISLNNLKLQSIDILYLHNVIESQVINKELLDTRIAKAFEFLENARKNKKIQFYGMATWNCFRVSPSNVHSYESLDKLVKIAEKVGGKDHGFRFIQVPINIMHPEAFTEKYQTLVDKEGKVGLGALTAVCNELQINLISSSPLLQGNLVNLPLENTVFNVRHNASKHIQFIRSIPAESLKCTLVGMKTQINVHNNLEILKKSPMSATEFQESLLPKKRTPYIEDDSKAV